MKKSKEVIKFFLLVSQFKSAQLVLETYGNSPTLLNQPIEAGVYKQKHQEFVGISRGLDQIYHTCLQNIVLTREVKENFLLLELNLNDPRGFMHTAKMYLEELKKDEVLKDVFKAIFHISSVIFELLEKEHTFINGCRQLKVERLDMIIQRYLPEGQYPLIEKIAIKKREKVVAALNSLIYFKNLTNLLQMDLETAWNFAQDLSVGLVFVRDALNSDDFKKNIRENLTELTKNFNELNRIRQELLERADNEWNECYLILLSDSGCLEEQEKNELNNFFREDGLDPKNNENFQNYLWKICQRVGMNKFRTIEELFYKMYYLGRDKEYLKTAQDSLSQPIQKVTRYHLTLKELPESNGFNILEAFLLQHEKKNHQQIETGLFGVIMIQEDMEIIIKSLKEESFVINEIVREEERPHEEASQKLTDSAKHKKYKELIKDTMLSKIEMLSKAQENKNCILHFYSISRAEPKKIFLDALKLNLEKALANDEIILSKSKIEEIVEISTSTVPEKNREAAFKGSKNRTGKLKDNFLDRVKEIDQSIKRQSSVFDMVEEEEEVPPRP